MNASQYVGTFNQRSSCFITHAFVIFKMSQTKEVETNADG